MQIIVLTIFIAITFYGCVSPKKNDGKIHVLATTGIIADILSNSLDSSFVVESLMGPGVDPHLYKASAKDVGLLSSADIIVYNGLHLEGKMTEILKKVGKHKIVIAVSDGIPESSLMSLAEDIHDPHLWFDISLYSKGLQHVYWTLNKHYPIQAKSSRDTYEKYQKKLNDMHAWTKQRIEFIPAKQRILITAHDAFGYFGRAYGMQVVGLQGISTVAEFGIQDIMRLSALIKQYSIRSIFIESSVPKRSIESVMYNVQASGGRVGIGGQLFSDALDSKSKKAGTYLGMLEVNVQTIVFHGINTKSC